MSDGYRCHTCVLGAPPMSRTHVDDEASWQGTRVHPSVRMDWQSYVETGTERPTTVGDGSWLMAYAIIGHDAIIGENVEVSTGSIVAGFAEVGDNTRVGVGARILNRVKIGKGCRIGAGAVVTKDVPDGGVWAGVPARQLAHPCG